MGLTYPCHPSPAPQFTTDCCGKEPTGCNICYVKIKIRIWCDFDRASSLICGNKMPTRCKRGFYFKSYCLLNMFRAPLCPSSGAQEYYTVVAACGILCCGFQVVGLVWSWGLWVRFAGCCLKHHPANRTHNLQLHIRPATWKPQHEIPQAATTV